MNFEHDAFSADEHEHELMGSRVVRTKSVSFKLIFFDRKTTTASFANFPSQLIRKHIYLKAFIFPGIMIVT